MIIGIFHTNPRILLLTPAFLRASEGRVVKAQFKGPVAATLQDILGGLRSACTYVGASKLKELSKRTTFIRVSQQANEVFSSSTISK